MRTGFVGSIWLAAVCAVLCFASTASAQKEPDMRAIAPFVMIVADTSGSMEWRPDCQCTTTDCNCYPDCSLLNDAQQKAPPGKKNRWAMLLESLTGSFTDFQCVPLTRTDPAHFTYDIGYPKPFHRPWACPGGATWCAYPGTETAPIQIQNGLLDNYASRIRFGLATFDGMRTYTGAGDLVTARNFNQSLSNGEQGSYSYGGAKVVRYPTCGEDHLIDSGIRSASAPEGGLISLNSALCTTPPCEPSVVNAAIQNSLLNTRTFGGTPTASALDDLYYHFKTELNDPMASCRERYAILITDGYPDDDFREYPVPGCDCAARGNCPPDENPLDMKCPYPTAVQAAYDLKHGRSTSTSTDEPQLQTLFVVGMSIADNASRVGLNAIASAGGSVDSDKDGNEAFFADDPATLTSTLDQLLGDLTRPISRSVPAFATGRTGLQYQVSAGFTISSETVAPGFTPPWKGILERRRFLCTEKGDVSSPTLSDDDRFDVQLNKQSARSLWTALPTSPTRAKVEGLLDRLTADTQCGINGCTRTELRDVPTALFGPIDEPRKVTLLQWMYGDTGSVRANMKLGDIYHSSPAIVGPPVEDPGDQSYTLFRESRLIQDRPVMMYVNSNDGILHGFVLEDYLVGGTSYKAGRELWGFVPPNLLDNLDSQLTAHRLNLDATPVVKDVYFSKGNTPSALDYKTVLITGMRAGGNAYMALDVTDPQNPKFMWQFWDLDMGETYGQAEIVQARYSWPPGQPASLRAMAILPGGKGEKGNSGPGCSSTTFSANSMRSRDGTASRFATKSDKDLKAAEILHRAEVQCWGSKGRALYFVDVETGKLIKKIYDDDNTLSNGIMFPSPVIGSPTAYQDAVGTTATEGFVIDADGVLWRIDLTSTDPRKDDALTGWTVRPFHDLFWDLGPTEGETSYERPILSLDELHQLVVIVGTGDTDNFEKTTVMNRVVSLTELVKSPTPVSPSDYVAGLNWELRADDRTDGTAGFVRSELVTGTMSLFAEQLFLASFISVGTSTDPCSSGLGRLWSVHFNQRDPARVNSTYGSASSGAVRTFGPMRIAVTQPDGTASADLGLFNIPRAAAEPNLLVLGLGSTQRITCDATGDNIGNYYSPNSSLVSIKQQTQPSIWIVAQASSDNRARNRAGSRLGTLEVQMNRPLEFSQVSSWAGSIE
jgi:type IV pilus assembly protein PilY1